MKRFPLLLLVVGLFFSATTRAQAPVPTAAECPLKKTTDEFSGKPKITTGFFDLGVLKLSIDATGNEIDYFFIVRNQQANCMGENSEAHFIFEGGKQKIEVRNTGGDNCNGFFHYTMKGGAYTPSNLTKLATKKVVMITISDRNDKQTVVSLSPKEQDLLMKLSACVAAEAKTLPK
ncbi:hypothetical protein KJS94_04090 [Flavihumibacter rivuli]|uniref:hypothetical protein n=1 Tax=Flavihumibacter rivuli TaxID=2838156 RepID=UPI001BDEAED4|nr:hypothetical protein [Flavihumibacter rivuli]ULQ57381.1 hypothetical protein KJS94_04090 [Flavihumibacter rivuli]